MKNSQFFSKTITTAAVALVALLAGATVARAQALPESFRLTDTEQRQGPFLVSGRDYFVVLQSKRLSGISGHPAQETLVGFKVLDTGGHVVRQESFSYEITDDCFTRRLSASAAMLAGMGGSALAIEFFESRPGQPLQQSWMLFGVVNNRLEQFGLPLPVGQGGAVGGVVTAVMVQGGIAVVPMASQAEPFELPVWTGNFYAGVPLRISWAQTQWSQGVQCFASSGGRLREDSCNMRVEARLQPVSDSSAVLLAPEPRQNVYTVRYVPLRSGAKIEILGTRAIVGWKENEGRVECHLSDVWLRVRINDAEGWVNSSEAFSALGLSTGNVSE